jgi:hypothetical protein
MDELKESLDSQKEVLNYLGSINLVDFDGQIPGYFGH